MHFFQVFVNDGHLVDFTHRGNPDNISVLGIKGSVHILETEYLGSMVSVSVALFLLSFVFPSLSATCFFLLSPSLDF